MEDQLQGQRIFGNDYPPQSLPNATAVLILGIASIVSCCCYSIPGLLCGIIALVLASKDMARYREQPTRYTSGSLSNLKAGRICAIIGLSFSALYFICIVIVIGTIGWATLTHPDQLQEWIRTMQEQQGI